MQGIEEKEVVVEEEDEVDIEVWAVELQDTEVWEKVEKKYIEV